MPKLKTTITFRYAITGSAELERNMMASTSYAQLETYLREVQQSLQKRFKSADVYVDLTVGRVGAKNRAKNTRLR